MPEKKWIGKPKERRDSPSPGRGELFRDERPVAGDRAAGRRAYSATLQSALRAERFAESGASGRRERAPTSREVARSRRQAGDAATAGPQRTAAAVSGGRALAADAAVRSRRRMEGDAREESPVSRRSRFHSDAAAAPESPARRWGRSAGLSTEEAGPSSAGEGAQRIWPTLSSWREALAVPRTSAPDYWLLAVVGAMVVLGLVMLYSASFALAAEYYGSPMFYLGKQLLWVVFGVIGALAAMRLDYRFWRRYSVAGMAVVIVLLIAVKVLPESVAPVINGAKRWISLGPISIQPSQLAYLVFVVYIADWLSKRGQKLRQVAYGLVPFATILGVLSGLIMLEPDMGTAVMLVLIGAVVFVVAGADLKQFALAGALSGVIFFLFARFSPYRWARMTSFLDPWSAPSDVGYHLVHNLMALGSGGFFGVGLGQGRQKFEWLPSPHTDSIFAVIGEELGLLGCMLFIGLFLWLAFRGYTISLRAPDRYGLLLGVGVTTWLCFQGFLNMAVVAGLLPFTGLTLPFVSYGGSSLACCMTATGLLLNLSCHQKREDAHADIGRGDWWARLSRLGHRFRPAPQE